MEMQGGVFIPASNEHRMVFFFSFYLVLCTLQDLSDKFISSDAISRS